jgi:hypothetical protein
MRCFEGLVYDMQSGAWVALRAVLGHWAGDGLPLPQAKSPPTVERRVTLFRPEPWQWGSGFWCCVVGVGRGIGQLHCRERTPLRKIRRRFQDCKHTSLISLVGEYTRVRASPLQ